VGLLGTTGCGYILHPERRGRTDGRVDTTILVFDLLWLLPGLIPGIICLAVDFGSGAIYGSTTTVKVSGRSRPRARVEVELDGGIVAEALVAGAETPRLAAAATVDAAALEARGRVRVHGPDGEVAEADAASLLASLRGRPSSGG
jgi:hypothetical protein